MRDNPKGNDIAVFASMPINQDLLSKIQSNCFREIALSLNDEELTDEDIIKLVEALKFNHYVKQLYLESNYISSIGAQSLATLHRLEVLNVWDNRIGPQGAIALAKSNLYKLDIRGNPIGDNIAAFAWMPSLIELKASDYNITDIGAGQLLLSKSIKRLILEGGNFTGEFLENIVSNTVLEELYLLQSRINKEYCRYIAQNSTLKILSLTSNFIKDEGAILLAKSNSLEELKLSQCFVGDKGAIALSQNKILKKLELFHNKITEIGAKAFVNNTTLTYLSLVSNPFDLEKVKDLCKYYNEKRDKVFIRTQEDIEALLKNFNENNAINSIPAASMETSPSAQPLKSSPSFISALENENNVINSIPAASMEISLPARFLKSSPSFISALKFYLKGGLIKDKEKIEEKKVLKLKSSKINKFFSE